MHFHLIIVILNTIYDIMSAYKTLFTELDRSEFEKDYEYRGCLEEYTYNGISYAQSSITYYSILLGMYREFLIEWVSLSEEVRSVVRMVFDEIKNKRYINDTFFFDVPTRETVTCLVNDKYVPRRDKEMARFVCDMAEQQSYFLMEVMRFLEGNSAQADIGISQKTETEIVIEMLADYPEILSTSDVGKIFNRSDYTIREWERKGKLINVAEDATEDKDTNSNGHRKRRQSLLFRKSDIIKDMNLRAMLAERTL